MTAFFHHSRSLAEGAPAGCRTGGTGEGCAPAVSVAAPRNRARTARLIAFVCIGLLLVSLPPRSDSVMALKVKLSRRRGLRKPCRCLYFLREITYRWGRNCFLPVNTNAKYRLLARSLDVDRNLCPGAFFLEVVVDRLEQKSLPAAHHLRDRGLHLRGSTE